MTDSLSTDVHAFTSHVAWSAVHLICQMTKSISLDYGNIAILHLFFIKEFCTTH